jgi:hypothetical protein
MDSKYLGQLLIERLQRAQLPYCGLLAKLARMAEPTTGIAALADALAFTEAAHLELTSTEQLGSFGTMMLELIQPDVPVRNFSTGALFILRLNPRVRSVAG